MRRTPTAHIETRPDFAGGRHCIAGTRIRVQDVVAWTELGRSPDEIVNMYPHVTLADVHAALAHYHDHQTDIDRQMREDEEFVVRFKAEYVAKTRPDDNGHSISPG